MEPDPEAKWYAVRTRPWAEKVVREHLRGHRIETFLPLLSKVSQWKDQQKRIEWSLFFGICFARLTSADQRLALQSPGAVEIIGRTAGHPEPIPDEEIAALQRVIGSRRAVAAHPALHDGMVVEVILGPLVGLRGILLETRGRLRLVVAVRMMSHGAAVDVEPEEVRPL